MFRWKPKFVSCARLPRIEAARKRGKAAEADGDSRLKNSQHEGVSDKEESNQKDLPEREREDHAGRMHSIRKRVRDATLRLWKKGKDGELTSGEKVKEGSAAVARATSACFRTNEN